MNPLPPSNDRQPDQTVERAEPAKVLPDAARRALAEAEDRRIAADAEKAQAGEHGGPAGLEPTRFGDWERKGLAIDF